MTAPGTGSLRGDLLLLAVGMASHVQSEIGRRLQVTNVIGNPELPSAQIRRDVWPLGSGILRAVVDRARERRESPCTARGYSAAANEHAARNLYGPGSPLTSKPGEDKSSA
jgi:hypothetical protein